MARSYTSRPQHEDFGDSASEDDTASSTCDDDDEGDLTMQAVFQEERDCIDRLRAERAPDGGGGVPFALAFSGGGIRAAAFQAGVLWRLAQTNRLKDVEYLSAVSGGGYIAASFATHCLDAQPPQAGQVKEWYLKVVARTLTRMQENSGDFVRDCMAFPGGPKDGAGCLPRMFDLPILLLTLACTMMINPIMFTVAILVPAAVIIDLFFGAAMRAIFCSSSSDNVGWLSILLEWSPIRKLAQVSSILTATTFIIFALTKLIPACKLGKRIGGQRPHASRAYLIGHAAKALMVRATVGSYLIIAFLLLVPSMQVASYQSSPEREQLQQDACAAYIAERDMTVEVCSDYYGGRLWYDADAFQQFRNVANRTTPISSDAGSTQLDKPARRTTVFSIFFAATVGVVAVIVAALCCIPIIGSHAFVGVMFAAGPVLFLALTMTTVQYTVFGPVTRNTMGLLPYSVRSWKDVVTCSLMAALVLLPFYEELRSLLHLYYQRTLTGNYFAGGRDIRINTLAEHPYCPFVLMTGTSSDFQPPGDTDTISEVSFSALHCGGEETGYVRTQGYRKLSKCTALTAAGCLDAISLSMSDALSLRFWLEVLNLSWGDYILFEKQNSPMRQWLSRLCGKFEGHCDRFLHRAPCSLLIIVLLVMMNVGWYELQAGRGHCTYARTLFMVVLVVFFSVIGLSFFAFLPGVDILALSPMIRQIHQATKYIYVGSQPPRMLYVTDGGVKDCTSIVQLMMRRCERILLVLAAADANDELGQLRSAMESAVMQKIGSFYDPLDPRRNLDVLFSDFARNKDLPYLHVGISYCWDGVEASSKTGHLYIIKNRLPSWFEGQPIAPFLTEEEILGHLDQTSSNGDPEGWGDLRYDQLGPFGCCDCCHTSGFNCGPKFPHGTFTNYLYLTPQWFNGLARLGYAASVEAIEVVTRASKLEHQWEQTVSH